MKSPVTLQDVPEVDAVIVPVGVGVKEIFHDRSFGPADVSDVRVSCILETRDFEHVQQVHQALQQAGIEAQVG